jgi:hypothetical protein
VFENVLDVQAVVSDLRNSNPQDVAHLLERVAHPLGRDVTLYLVDFQQVVLQAVPSLVEPRVVAEENVATSLAGRAFTTVTPVVAERPDGVRVWVPVHEHSVRTGVLAVTVPQADPATLEHCESLAALAGLLVAGASRYTDLIHVRRRGRGMTLAASMQWDLLPPLTLRSGRAVVTGLLEPAYEVAGDAFDYALNGDRLDVGVFDGMGHGIGSSLLTTLAVGSYRHARRNGEDVPAMHGAVDGAVAQQYDGDAFVTGVLARLRLDTGELSWSNAGHPVPLLLRGRTVVGPLRCEPSPPFGLGDSKPSVKTEALEPGDRVVFYTDGVVEARTAGGAEFGLDRLIDLLEREAAAETAPEETLRRLIRSTLEHQGGDLQDDATLVLLHWAGPDPGAGAGADETQSQPEPLIVPHQDPGPE